MPRCARWGLPAKPHHITQRGTGRQRVFYSRRDCRVYLEQLRVNAAAVLVLASLISLTCPCATLAEMHSARTESEDNRHTFCPISTGT